MEREKAKAVEIKLEDLLPTAPENRKQRVQQSAAKKKRTSL